MKSLGLEAWVLSVLRNKDEDELSRSAFFRRWADDFREEWGDPSSQPGEMRSSYILQVCLDRHVESLMTQKK
jgi:hypothetical protein